MRTPEEWDKIIFECEEQDFTWIIKQIQDEAWNSAINAATGVVLDEIDYHAAPSSHEDIYSCRKAILTLKKG